jgi:ATP-binding cassette, subfamily B, bacterial
MFYGVRWSPLVLQLESTECGAACLAMALARFGHAAPLSEVRRECEVSRDGATLLAIKRAAERYGLIARAVRVDPDGVRLLNLPAILFWNNAHFVLLEATLGGASYISDPGVGRRRLDAREMKAAFAGVALSLEKGHVTKRLPLPSKALSLYFEALRHQPAALAALALSAGAGEAIGLLIPAATQVATDYIVSPRQQRLIVPLVSVLLLALALRSGLGWTRSRLLARLQYTIDGSILSRCLIRLSTLGPDYFNRRSTGDIVARFDSIAMIRDAVVESSLTFLEAGVLFGYILLAWSYSYSFGLLIFAACVTRTLSALIVARTSRFLLSAEQAARAREVNVLLESFTDLEVTKAVHVESFLEKRLRERLCTRLNASGERHARADALGAALLLLDGCFVATLLCEGARLVSAHQISIGAMIAATSIYALATRPALALAAAIEQRTLIRGLTARLDDILDAPGIEAEAAVPITGGHLNVRDVVFTYNTTQPPILAGVSFEVAAGAKIAVIGRSGAGKSTLLSVVAGVVRPSTGTVSIDGIPRRARGQSHDGIGLVLQESFMFDESVYENVRLYDGSVDGDAVSEALHIASATALAHRLGHKAIGIRGKFVSAGERQRIALARALALRPRILLCDEATSAVEPGLEAEIIGKICDLSSTCIFVTHRVQSLAKFDRVLVLEHGKVLQDGAFQDLQRVDGIFRRLLDAELKRSGAARD